MIRNYGIGAQIIKSLKIKNMILVTRSKKSDRIRRIWNQNQKAGNYKMKKKILIVVASYYENIANSLLKSAK